MTAAALSLPIAAGTAALSTAGRVARWVASQYMRAPLSNTAIAGLVIFTAVAGSNALYFQAHKHPAPLFGVHDEAGGTIKPVQPVTPAVRPQKKLTMLKAPVVEKPAVEDAREPIGNSEIFDVQRKLEQLGFFDGTVDGLYGPRTARAIRNFEVFNDMPAEGQLTPEVIDAILSAPSIKSEARVQSVPAPAPLTVPDPVADPAPLRTEAAEQVRSDDSDPLTTQSIAPAMAAEAADDQPMPAPAAQAEPAVPVVEKVATVEHLPAPRPLSFSKGRVERVTEARPRRTLPRTPGEAMNVAAETAGDAIDTILSGVESAVRQRPTRKHLASRFVDSSATLTTTPIAEPEPTKAERLAVIAAPQAIAAVAPEAAAAEPVASELAATDVEASNLADAKPAVAEQDVDTVETASIAPAPTVRRAPGSLNDPGIVAEVQRGLSSLGFLHGAADGIPSEATAKAIRNFEVYYNYKVTGRITPELPGLLAAAGARI